MFIKYCVFPKDFKIFQTLAFLCFQRYNRTGRVKKNNNTLRKNTIFNEHPVGLYFFLHPVHKSINAEDEMEILMRSILNWKGGVLWKTTNPCQAKPQRRTNSNISGSFTIFVHINICSVAIISRKKGAPIGALKYLWRWTYRPTDQSAWGINGW